MIYETIQGEDVPALGFGTWKLNGQECVEGVEHAIDLGYRHIDTAEAYENEEEVGRGIKNSGVDREDLFVTTKVWHDHLDAVSAREATEASLRRLDMDYVDLLLQHWPDPDGEVPVEETLDALGALQEEGKARYIGVSNFTPTMLQKTLDYEKILCIQVEYHPFLHQQELLEMAREYDLLLTAYSPLARGKVFESDVLKEIAEQHGKSPAQVALRWLLQQEKVAAIPKAATAEHRQANLDIFDFELSGEEMDRIFQLGTSDGRIVDPGFIPAWDTA